MILTRSVLSTEYVRIGVKGLDNGEEIDPTGDDPSIAFTLDGAAPPETLDDLDWHAAEWETNPDGELIDGELWHYFARINVGPEAGPGGITDLTRGIWKPWLRQPDNPEKVIRTVGLLNLK
jgi:hypothetical protein